MWKGTIIAGFEAQRVIWKLSREIRDVFWNKEQFFTACQRFVHRDWIRIVEGERVRYYEMIQSQNRLIIKRRAAGMSQHCLVVAQQL